MNGLDKITARIEQDGRQEAEALLSQARAEAADITAKYEAQARTEAEKILARGRQDAAQREERLASVNQLDCRKAVLEAKQELLDEAFDRACEKLRALPEDKYVELLAELAFRASVTGQEELVFSPADRERVGPAVAARANEKLARAAAPQRSGGQNQGKLSAFLEAAATAVNAIAKGTAMLTVAGETRPIDGGFILSGGDVEVNCTFAALVRLQRNELSGQAAKVLFE